MNTLTSSLPGGFGPTASSPMPDTSPSTHPQTGVTAPASASAATGWSDTAPVADAADPTAGAEGGTRPPRAEALLPAVPQPRRKRWLAAVLLALAAGGALWGAQRAGWLGGTPAVEPPPGSKALVGGPAAAGSAAAAALGGMTPEQRLQTVATVNGKTIVQEELAGLLANGVDRAVALDRYINKVLAADAARGRYEDESRAMLAAAEREVLANLYLQRRSQELLKAVTDAQVAEYYSANVRVEDYAGYRLRYYLTRDQADAVNVRALLDKGDKSAQGRLAALAPGNANGGASDGWLGFQAIPYGLGRVVAAAKQGDVIGPVLVRDGLLLLVLDERREGKKPALDDVRTEIRALLADRQLSEELLALRKKAQIQLN